MWRKLALCKGHSADTFFFGEEMSRDAYQAKVKVAQEICNICPVSTECLKLGMESANIHFGVWGGMSSKDRIKMWKLNKAVRNASHTG